MTMSILEIKKVLEYLNIECNIDDINIVSGLSNSFDVYCNDRYLFGYLNLPYWHNLVVTSSETIMYKNGNEIKFVPLDDILKKSKKILKLVKQ